MNITDEEFEALISMKTTIPDTHLNDPAVQPASMKDEGGSVKEPTDKSLPAQADQADYCRAYSVWLRGGHASYPDASALGIPQELAEVLRRQCRDAQHKQIDGLRPAVSFTEAEARQAASDLRELAVTLCEENYLDYERICRVLAQKFDTWRKE